MSDPHRFAEHPGGEAPGSGSGDTSPLSEQTHGSLADELLSVEVAERAAAPAEVASRKDQAEGRNGASRLVQALGLLLVAVLAGLVWWLLRQERDPGAVAGDAAPAGDTTASSPAPEPHGFTPAVAPVRGADCAGHSYGEIRGFFRDAPCSGLARALYTRGEAGAKVLVSVSVVTMNSEDEARELKRLADTSGTGNVADLVREGRAPMANPPKVSGGEYASQRSGKRVTIVECASFGGDLGARQLASISEDALRLAGHVRSGG